MSFPWDAIRRVLGALTDLLTAGRAKGWWDKGQGPGTPQR